MRRRIFAIFSLLSLALCLGLFFMARKIGQCLIFRELFPLDNAPALNKLPPP